MHFVSLSFPTSASRLAIRLTAAVCTLLLAVLLWSAQTPAVSAQGPLDVDVFWGGGEILCPSYSQHFDIFLTNGGATPLANVTLEFVLPDKTYFNETNGRTTPGFTYNPTTRTVTWLTTLAPQETRRFEILVNTNTTNQAGETIVYTANATAEGGLTATDSQSMTFVECPTAVEIGSFAAEATSNNGLTAALIGVGLVSLGGLVALRRRAIR